jgi:hypothetical protein
MNINQWLIWGSHGGDYEELWDVPPSSLVEVYRRFGITYRLHHQERIVIQTIYHSFDLLFRRKVWRGMSLTNLTKLLPDYTALYHRGHYSSYIILRQVLEPLSYFGSLNSHVLHLWAYRWCDNSYMNADWLCVLRLRLISFVFSAGSCHLV